MSRENGTRRFIVLSGCSGGGKSALLAELRRRGHATIAEPGRRIIQAETDPASSRLPWNDLAGFADTAISQSLEDMTVARDLPGPVFFDRGLIDAIAAHEHATGSTLRTGLARLHRYRPTVFFVPPWREIYATDADRRHSFAAASAEYERLLSAYSIFGYTIETLPRVDVRTRGDIVLKTLARD